MYCRRKKIIITDKVDGLKHIIFTHEKGLDVVASSEEVSNEQILLAQKSMIPIGSLRNEGTWEPELIVKQIYKNHFGFSFRWILPNSIKDSSGRAGLIYCHLIAVYGKERSSTLVEKLSKAGAYLLYLYTDSLSYNPFSEGLWNNRVELIRSNFLNAIHEKSEIKNEYLDFLNNEFSKVSKAISSKELYDSLTHRSIKSFNKLTISKDDDSIIQIPKNYSTPIFYRVPQIYCSNIFNKYDMPCVYMPKLPGKYLVIEIVKESFEKPKLLAKKFIDRKETNMAKKYESQEISKFFYFINFFSLAISICTLLIVIFFIHPTQDINEISGTDIKNLINLEVQKTIDNIDMQGMVEDEVRIQMSNYINEKKSSIQLSSQSVPSTANTSGQLIELILDRIGSSGSSLTEEVLNKAFSDEILLSFSKVDQGRIKEMQNRFTYYDRNNNGELSSKELSVLLFNNENETSKSAEDLINNVLGIVNSSGSGLVPWELSKALKEKLIILFSTGDQKRIRVLQKDFNNYDKDENDKLSIQEVSEAIF
jgi:Ca2+-binding EF-hand superfamily protein